MSWFDDDDAFAEGLLDGLVDSENEGITEEADLPEELEVGDTVADLYVVEEVVRPGLARVRLMGVEHTFELRQFPELSQKRIWDQVEFVVNTTGFLTSEHLTYITDFGVCPIFGGYIVSEWVDGESLESMLNDGRQMELMEAIEFAVEVGSGLSVLHEVGLAHGLRDARDLIRDTAHKWRLLGTGLGTSSAFPPQTSLPLAPELEGVRGGSVQGDQFALAAALYGLLVGEIPVGENPFGPSELRVDLPETLDHAVMQAMHDDSQMRFSAIEDFVDVLVESARRWHEMSSVVQESSFAFSSVVIDEAPQNQVTTRPSEFAVLSRKMPSIVVTVDSLLSNRPQLSMSFSSLERLRREYRSNIMAGGIFVPTPKQLMRNQTVDIKLLFEPTGQKVKVEATVAQVTPSSSVQPGGVGLIFDGTAKTNILEFLKQVDPVLGLAPGDVIIATRALDIHSALEPAEAFLLSRLSAPMSLSVLRATFQGLPFDFEGALGGLIAKDYVGVKDQVMPVNPPRSAQRPVMMARDEVQRTGSARVVPVELVKAPEPKPQARELSHAERALEQAASLQQRGNFRAAIELLEAAHSALPDGRFLLRLVELYGTFQKNWDKANERLGQAARLMPNSPDVAKMKTWVASQREDEILRVIYAVDVPDAKFRFLRLDPQLHRVWFEVYVGGNRPRREIHVADYGRGRGAMLRQAQDPIRMAAVPGNSPELASFEAARDQIKNTKLNRREKLIDRAQSSMDPGPWFRKGPSPVAWTTHGTFLVFDRNPDVLEEGLFIVNQGSEMAPLKLDPDGTRGMRPVMCPDDQGAVAWVSLRPSCAIYVAEPFQSPQKRFETQQDAIVYWLNPESLIALAIATGEVLEIPRRRGGLQRTIATVKNACGMWLDAAQTHAAILTNQRHVYWLEISTGKILGELTLPSFPDELLLRDDGFLAARNRDHVTITRFGKSSTHRLDIVVDPGCFSPAVRWAGREPLVLMITKSDRCEVVRVDPRRLFTV